MVLNSNQRSPKKAVPIKQFALYLYRKFMSIYDMSYDRATVWFNLANAIVLGALLITFLATWVAIVMSGIRDKRADERMVQNEKETAKANAEAEKAKADIAQANAQIAQAQNSAAQAQLATEQFKAQLAWRVIPPPAQTLLALKLSQSPAAIHLTYVAGDPECIFLAIQFEKVFMEARWRISTTSIQSMTSVFFGISIPDDSANMGSVTNIRAAFTAAGIPFITQPPPPDPGGGMSYGTQRQPNEVEVYIGSKRPPL
jgi:hypothetical protein